MQRGGQSPPSVGRPSLVRRRRKRQRVRAPARPRSRAHCGPGRIEPRTEQSWGGSGEAGPGPAGSPLPASLAMAAPGRVAFVVPRGRCRARDAGRPASVMSAGSVEPAIAYSSDRSICSYREEWPPRPPEQSRQRSSASSGAASGFAGRKWPVTSPAEPRSRTPRRRERRPPHRRCRRPCRPTRLLRALPAPRPLRPDRRRRTDPRLDVPRRVRRPAVRREDGGRHPSARPGISCLRGQRHRVARRRPAGAAQDLGVCASGVVGDYGDVREVKGLEELCDHRGDRRASGRRQPVSGIDVTSRRAS